MSDMELAKHWERVGWVFQIPMILLFATLPLYERDVSYWGLLTLPGSVLFLWCLWELYFRDARRTGLLVGGPFRYTRHPMYIGLLIMSMCYLVWPAQSLLFALNWLSFVLLLVAAAWCQERETLARFGGAAEDYYARTPRLPFLV